MSMITFTTSGYGFYTQDITVENLYKFLKNHPSDDWRIKDILESVDGIIEEEGTEDLDEILDMYDDFLDDGVDTSSISGIIGIIIMEETGLTFAFADRDDYDDEALLYEPLYPWQLNDKEKELLNEGKLTRKYIEEVLNPYAEELGVDSCQYIDLTYTG